MADDRPIIVNSLFIAVPELQNNIDYLRRLHELGWIDDRRYEVLRSARVSLRGADRLGARMEGKPLIQRLMMVAPELVSESTVNLLSVTGMIDSVTAKQLRLAMRSMKALSVSGKRDTYAKRMMRLMDVLVSEEQIDLWLAAGVIDRSTASRYREFLALNKGVITLAEQTQRGKNLFDRLWYLAEGFSDSTVLRGMALTGMINPRQAAVYRSLVRLTKRGWTAFEGSAAADGFKDRLLMVMAGMMHDDLIDGLISGGIVDKKYRSSLELMVRVGRQVNDRMFERVNDRKYRILPGQTPISTFARATRRHDDDILKLLAQTARDSGREARALAALGGRGNVARANQLRLVRASLHEQMRLLWEGQGYLTIMGEREAAEAAADALDDLLGPSLARNLGSNARRSLLWQAKTGVDSYISRAENRQELSRRVYKNRALWDGRLDRKIDMLLLQGKSANEFAKEIEGLINPRVSGGVRYAAMRLARTEMNNAFHLTTIRYTREMPWVKGMKWNLSGSHGRPDVCNQMADRDHDGLGPGVYKKANVPGKPHPHCLCFVTTLVMTDSEFAAAQRAGRFNRYLNGFSRGETVEPNTSSLWRALGTQAVYGLGAVWSPKGYQLPSNKDGKYRYSTPEPFFKTQLPTPPPGLYD